MTLRSSTIKKLEELADGEYTLTQLSQKLEFDKPYTSRLMNRLRVKKRLEIDKNNRNIITYIWVNKNKIMN